MMLRRHSVRVTPRFCSSTWPIRRQSMSGMRALSAGTAGRTSLTFTCTACLLELIECCCFQNRQAACLQRWSKRQHAARAAS